MRRPLALVLVATLATACSGGGAAHPTTTAHATAVAPTCTHRANATATPFGIGVVDTTVGSQSYPGPGHGAAAAAAYVNCERGGFDGHPVKIVECAAGTDAGSETKCGEQLAANEAVRVVITGYLFAPTGLYAALAAATKPIVGTVPLTAIDFTAAGIRFYSAASPGVSNGLAVFALDIVPVVHTALVVVSDVGAAVSVQQLLASAGIAVNVVSENAPDLATAMPAADLVIALVDQKGCVALAKARASLKKGAPVLATSLCLDQAVDDAVGLKAIDGWYLGSDRPLPQLSPGANSDVDALIRSYSRFTKSDPTEPGALAGWSDVLAVLAALQPIGFDDATGLGAAAGINDFKGPVPLGPSHVSCTGDDYPTLCATEMFVSRVSGSRVISALPVNQTLDASTFDPAAYKAAHG